MKLGTYRVSLDRPGAGWDCEVKARSAREAMKLANNLHPNMGLADTVYEIPTITLAEKNLNDAKKHLNSTTSRMEKAKKKFDAAVHEEQQAYIIYARARAIYNMSREEA